MRDQKYNVHVLASSSISYKLDLGFSKEYFCMTNTKLWYKLFRNPFQQAASAAFTCTGATSTNRCVWLSMYSCMCAAPTIQLAATTAQLVFHGKILLLLQISRQGGTTEGRSSYGSRYLCTFGEASVPESEIAFSQVHLGSSGEVSCALSCRAQIILMFILRLWFEFTASLGNMAVLIFAASLNIRRIQSMGLDCRTTFLHLTPICTPV